MQESLFIIIALLLIAVGLLGTLLPILPGLIISYAGLWVYKYGANPDFSAGYLILFGVLTLISLFLSYVIPLKTTAKYGGSRYGKAGGLLGTIVGLFFPPIGFLIGMLLGVFIGELIHDINDTKKALKATKGAFLGFLYGTGFNFLIGLAMFLVVIIDTFNN